MPQASDKFPKGRISTTRNNNRRAREASCVFTTLFIVGEEFSFPV